MQQEYNNIQGILFMLLNAFALSILYTTTKYTSQFLNSHQVVFFYKLFILIIITPWVLKDGIKGIYTNRIKLHIIRGTLSISGTLLFMYALHHVDMVDATVLGYLEQITLVTIGMFYFKEDITKSKIFSVILSIFGAFIILYPDIISFEQGSLVPIFFKQQGRMSFNHYYIYTLLAITCWTLNSIIVKIMGKTEKSKIQLFYVTLFSCIFTLPIAFVEWESTLTAGFHYQYPNRIITFEEIGFKLEYVKYIILISVCYFIHSIAFFNAYKKGEISVIIPFYYTKLIFIGILQFYIFSKIPSSYSYIGYILIVGSNLFLAQSEAKRKKKASSLSTKIIQ